MLVLRDSKEVKVLNDIFGHDVLHNHMRDKNQC